MWVRLPTLLVLCALYRNVAGDTRPGFPVIGQAKQCRRLEWSCRLEPQCIDAEAVCDGRRDCRDGSDETAVECSGSDFICGPHVFRCAYGACVDRNLVCDGQRDCVDGSDEDPSNCPGAMNFGNIGYNNGYNNGYNDGYSNSYGNSSDYGSEPCQPPSRFKCNNSQCVGHLDMCDGKVDCTDKSDESAQLCATFTCTPMAFRCSYGACVDASLRCDGVSHCADGSDENIYHCSKAPAPRPGSMYPFLTDQARPTNSPRLGPRPNYPYITDQGRPTEPSQMTPRPNNPYSTNQPRKPGTSQDPRRPGPSTPSSSQGACRLPEHPRNGHWLLEASQCFAGVNCEVNRDMSSLPAGTQLVYSCHDGYALNGSADVFCGIKGRWSHYPTCVEIRCPPVRNAARLAECSYDNNYVSCDVPVRPGTTAKLECQNSYTEDTTDLASRKDIKCNETGQWDYKPINCVPVCGVPSSGIGRPLIVHGVYANATDFPWHGTLYEDKNGVKLFICGATIIKNNLLITAAHCVYDESMRRVDPTRKFYVAVGNFFRDYDFDGDANKVTAVVTRAFVGCYYYGASGNYANDIAILEIDRTLVFSAVIMPVCLDTSGDYDKAALEVGNEGVVPGFGRTATGDSSFTLQKLQVPVVSLNICKNVSDSRRFVTKDKICAGYTNGSAICDGDSGGGLVIRTDDKMYLRGIVSVGVGTSRSGAVRTCDSFSYTLYTQVSNWMEGITDVIHRVVTNRVEEGLCIR